MIDYRLTKKIDARTAEIEDHYLKQQLPAANFVREE